MARLIAKGCSKMVISKAASREEDEAYSSVRRILRTANGARSAKSVSPKVENVADAIFHQPFLGQLRTDRLHLGIQVQGFMTHLTPPSGLFIPSEG